MIVDPGIYRIVNTIANRTYIGSSLKMSKRLIDHRYELRHGKHKNIALQRSWNKYGETAFVFEPLLNCEALDCMRREQAFIDAYHEHGLPLYNMRPSSYSRAGIRYRMSGETRLKMSQAAKGKKKSEATRAKMRAVAKARQFSAETRAKMSTAAKRTKNFYGHRHTVEARLKIGEASRGRPCSEETRMKKRLAQLGKKRKPGYTYSPERLANHSNVLRKAWMTRRLYKQDQIKEQMRLNLELDDALRERDQLQEQMQKKH